ncbi:helix-turn-helix domain-containing protein [Streptomyces sp. 3213.3]|uniref:helix-turn-helix domain-containing protein n=1 Tax=Streptomyces sp. 3213.3 TaxID=1855348 RepID=UPI003FA6FF07
MATMNHFGMTLRGWRERMTPQDIGVEAGGERRVPGLRREELARLAGISVDYLVLLEQGRARNPSAQVVTALARALRLHPSERDHLFRCAHLAPPSAENVSTHIPASVQAGRDAISSSACSRREPAETVTRSRHGPSGHGEGPRSFQA